MDRVGVGGVPLSEIGGSGLNTKGVAMKISSDPGIGGSGRTNLGFLVHPY